MVSVRNKVVLITGAGRGIGEATARALAAEGAKLVLTDVDEAPLTALVADLGDVAVGVRADVRATSVLALGPAPAPLDLVMMDPPYGTGAAQVALDKLGRLGWFGPATWISVETAKQDELDVPGFTVDASRVHGKARVTLLRRDG